MILEQAIRCLLCSRFIHHQVPGTVTLQTCLPFLGISFLDCLSGGYLPTTTAQHYSVLELPACVPPYCTMHSTSPLHYLPFLPHCHFIPFWVFSCVPASHDSHGISVSSTRALGGIFLHGDSVHFYHHFLSPFSNIPTDFWDSVLWVHHDCCTSFPATCAFHHLPLPLHLLDSWDTGCSAAPPPLPLFVYTTAFCRSLHRHSLSGFLFLGFTCHLPANTWVPACRAEVGRHSVPHLHCLIPHIYTIPLPPPATCHLEDLPYRFTCLVPTNTLLWKDHNLTASGLSACVSFLFLPAPTCKFSTFSTHSCHITLSGSAPPGRTCLLPACQVPRLLTAKCLPPLPAFHFCCSCHIYLPVHHHLHLPGWFVFWVHCTSRLPLLFLGIPPVHFLCHLWGDLLQFVPPLGLFILLGLCILMQISLPTYLCSYTILGSTWADSACSAYSVTPATCTILHSSLSVHSHSPLQDFHISLSHTTFVLHSCLPTSMGFRFWVHCIQMHSGILPAIPTICSFLLLGAQAHHFIPFWVSACHSLCLGFWVSPTPSPASPGWSFREPLGSGPACFAVPLPALHFTAHLPHCCATCTVLTCLIHLHVPFSPAIFLPAHLPAFVDFHLPALFSAVPCHFRTFHLKYLQFLFPATVHLFPAFAIVHCSADLPAALPPAFHLHPASLSPPRLLL